MIGRPYLPSLLLCMLLMPSVLFPLLTASAQQSLVEHVIVIGLDGTSPSGIRAAQTPVLDSLLKRSAYTMEGQAVLPTSSSPNWASMIMGAPPEKHGVTSNAWQPGKDTLELECEGVDGKGQASGTWPTIFGELRRQRPGAVIACYNDWIAFDRLIEKGVLDRHGEANLIALAAQRSYRGIVRRASRYFKKKHPDLLFVHLDHIDHAGHLHGHGSDKYHKAVEDVDHMIGKLLKTVERSGRADRTAILITADHGGIGHGHGGDTPEERTIPWMLVGPGIPAKELPNGMNTYDTAPTIAALLGLSIPKCWEGEVLREALPE